MSKNEAKSTPGRWAFITTSATRRRPDAAQKNLIRRHIMRDIGYSRRRCQETAASSAADASLDSDGYQSSNSVNVSISWSLPPRVMAPVVVGDDSYHVLHQMFTNEIPLHLRVYRDMWYPVCTQDPAAFHQMLACFANHLFHLHGTSDHKLQRIMISNHMRALSLVRERISTMSETVAEEFLLAILLMACYSHVDADFHSWNMHMAAIRKIMSQTKITKKHNLGFSYLYRRLEAIGSYTFGTPPPFEITIPAPTPPIDRTILSQPLVGLIYSISYRYQVPLFKAFQALLDLDKQLAEPASNISPSIWDQPLKLDSLVDPVAQMFLFPLPSTDEKDADFPTFSSLRAGALLYIAELRRRSGISPVITTYQVSRLRKSLDLVDESRSLDPIIHLWLATVGALESTEEADERYFSNRIQSLWLELGIETFTDYEKLLHEVAWTDTIFGRRLSSFFTHLKTVSLINLPEPGVTTFDI